MQTFLPYSDFKISAKVLDNRRLGKQRVEAYQIARILTGVQQSKGFSNHPAVLMWKGHENSLIEYGITICDEWINRGFKDTVKEKLRNMCPLQSVALKPSFIGNEKFHASHRSNLLRKNFDHYSKFGWSENVELPYFWPSKDL